MGRADSAAVARVVLVVALALGGCAGKRDSPAPSAGNPAATTEADPKTVDELRVRIQKVLDETHVPGAGVAIVRDGEIVWTAGVGKADVARGLDVTADTPFRIGSITKSLVALTLLALVDRGKIDLDARLAAVAPEIAAENPWEATHPLRVAHALEHTAGYDDSRFCDTVDWGDRPMPLGRVLEQSAPSLRPRWAPGTRMSYANVGYTVAGYLIEKVSGRSFEEMVAATLFAPLDMKHATFEPPANARVAQGYVGVPPAPFAPFRLLNRPAGSAWASASDLAALVRFWVHRGKVGETQVVSESGIARSERAETLPYTLGMHDGLGNQASPEAGFATQGHEGDIDGFAAAVRYVPEARAGWVVLLNGTPGGADARERISSLLAEYALRDKPRPKRRQMRLTTEELAAFAGHYEDAAPRKARTASWSKLIRAQDVAVDGDGLRVEQLGWAPTHFVPVGGGAFRRPQDATTTVLFTHDDVGAPILIRAGGYYEKRSPWKGRLRAALLLGSLLVAAFGVAGVLVWAPRWLFGKRYRMTGGFVERLLTALASVAGLGTLASLVTLQSTLDYATPNPKSIGFFVASLVFAVLAPAALIVAGVRWYLGRPMPRWTRARVLAIATADAVLLTLYLAWGLVGWRTWRG